MSRAPTRPLLRRTLHGALSGALAAACMTVARLLAHRAGVIRQMRPQAMEAWATHHSPLSLPLSPSSQSLTRARPALHHVADQAIHLGYGATLGAVYGLIPGRGPTNARKVLGYGVVNWIFGWFLLLPGLKILRPEWRAQAPEIAVDLGAHLLDALALGVVSDELEAQSMSPPLSYPLSMIVKTG